MPTYNGFKTIEGKEFYEKTLLMGLRDNNILMQFAKKTTLPKNHGEVISWRKKKPVPVQKNADGTVRKLVEGITPSSNKLEFVEYKATLAEYGDWIRLTKKLSNLAIDPILTEAAEGLGESAGNTFEDAILEVLYTCTNIVYGGTGKTKDTIVANDIMDVTLLHRVKAYFEKRNVKPYVDGKYVMIISPDVEFDLKNATTGNASWIDIAKYTDKEHVMKGEIGSFMGFKFIVYNKLGMETGAGASKDVTLTNCIAFGKDAYGVVDLEGENGSNIHVFYNEPGKVGTDPLKQRQSLAWKDEGWACRILYPEALTIVKVPTQLTAMADIDEEAIYGTANVTTIAGTANKYQSYGVQDTTDTPSSEIVD